MNRLALVGLVVLLALAAPARAQLVGTDTAPGDSCAGFDQGAARMSADADQDGKQVTLICNGTTWEADAGIGSTLWLQSAGNIYYSSGNVGIGTTTPYSPLDIVSTSSLADLEISATGLSSGARFSRLRLYSQRGDLTTNLNNDSLATNPNKGWTIQAIGGGGAGGAEDDLQIVSNLLNNPAGHYAIMAFDGTTYRVGVGKNNQSPVATIHVLGNDATASDIAMVVQRGMATTTGDLTQWRDDTGAVLNVIDKSGSVGIGTPSPQSALDVNGGIKVASDSGTCAASKNGTIRYTSGASPPWEYCNGSAWVNFKQPRCQDDDTGECYTQSTRSNDDPDFTAANIANGVNILGVTGTFTGGLSGPSGCANIGDLCADGTVFAGYHPITQAHLFIPTTDQEQPGSPGTYTMNWKNATGTNDISTDSDNDGQVNHANRGGAIGDFQAFQACEDLGAGGQTDWYLPSRVELYYLWSVRGTIEAGGNIANFQNALYWSSTEYGTVGAWLQDFTDGLQSVYTKDDGYRLRCVRR